MSGSGKSTLAFDIVFNEGQRRYLESLNAYARQFVQPAARPDVDAITGIPPTVAIEQRTSRGGRKSWRAILPRMRCGDFSAIGGGNHRAGDETSQRRDGTGVRTLNR